jgi:hypothetical protein
VLATTNGFIVLGAFTAPNTFENCKFLVLVRHQDGHRFTDNLFGRIAEEPLCALIPSCDDAIEVLAYDCIITGLDNASELPRPLITFAQRSFGLAAFNEVRGLAGKHIQ